MLRLTAAIDAALARIVEPFAEIVPTYMGYFVMLDFNDPGFNYFRKMAEELGLTEPNNREELEGDKSVSDEALQ